MTHVITFTLPPTGEVQDTARLVSWQIQPGQTFTRDDVLLEIETDKSVIEIPAAQDGKMVEHLVSADSVIGMDTPLARLEFEGDAPEIEAPAPPRDSPIPPAALSSPAPPLSVSPAPLPTTAARPAPAPAPVVAQGQRRSATPAARSAMRASQLDAKQIQGSGPSGRITLADVARTTPAVNNGRPSKAAIDTEIVDTRFGSIRVRIWEPAGTSTTSPSIVLIHGMFADIEAWASLALGLSRSGQRVLALDLPGHGESSAEVERFDDIVESAAQALAPMPGQRHILVGHSLGGAVAARLACRPALAAQALVLIAPMGLGTEIEHRFLKGVLHAGNNEAMGRELSRLTRAGTKPSDAYMAELRTRIETRRDLLVRMSDAASWNGVQQISITADLQAALCPITVLHGRADAIIPWEHTLNAPARAALHLIPDVGHMPQWEAATLTTEVILRASQVATLL